MEVGDSFWMRGQYEWSAYNAAKRLGITIALRAENEGYRVWRRT